MRTLKGFILFLFGIFVTVFETYVLIVTPFLNKNSTGYPDIQYWGLVFPSYFITLLISLVLAWVGYTMMTTKEPVRFTYEQAYENALKDAGMVDENSGENKGSKQDQGIESHAN